jgi:hypothetical protein
MRVFATHDAEGTIHHISMGPPDSPPAVVTAEPGLLVTEVAAPEITKLDPSAPEGQRELAEILQRFRVEKAEGTLVRKTPKVY